MTYFQDPRDGQRDALMHWVWGGVYPKWYSVVSEFKRTGDLMPVMTKFARIAPAGLVRYRGASFGPQYRAISSARNSIRIACSATLSIARARRSAPRIRISSLRPIRTFTPPM